MQDAIKSADPSVATGRVPKIGETSEGGPPGDVGKAISAGARGAEVGEGLAHNMNVQRRVLDTSDYPQAEAREAAECSSLSALHPAGWEAFCTINMVCLAFPSVDTQGH